MNEPKVLRLEGDTRYELRLTGEGKFVLMEYYAPNFRYQSLSVDISDWEKIKGAIDTLIEDAEKLPASTLPAWQF